MEASYLEELRLTAFKSFSNAVLPIEELTLLVGRNGSGKSNALDGLWALSRLAQGEEVRDALEGGREGPAVRGGMAGCAPLGSSFFSLGCTVRTGTATTRLDVRIQVEPWPQVVEETLWEDGWTLISTDPPQPDSGDIYAGWANRQRGRNPKAAFRNNRLLATQALARIPATTQGQVIHLAAARVLAALRAVFVLDPVPHLMRRYVPRRDVILRRDADNLSAAVGALLADPTTRPTLIQALGQLNEQEVVDVTTIGSELDDLMLTLDERFAGERYQVPARIMSDGTLRFLAILVALLQAPTLDTMPEPLASEDASGQTTLVVEELENGLHASQASLLLGLIREEVKKRRVRVLATAHSPALLDALAGDEHPSVIVCQRDRSGKSSLSRLTDLPNYPEVVAAGTLGQAAEQDRLRASEQRRSRPSDVLAEILEGGA